MATEAGAVGYSSPALGRVAELLALGPEAFGKAQLARAVEAADGGRRTNREIALREARLRAPGFAAGFALARLRCLRSPDDWAAAGGLFGAGLSAALRRAAERCGSPSPRPPPRPRLRRHTGAPRGAPAATCRRHSRYGYAS